MSGKPGRSGGKRAGSGRKLGSAAKKVREVIEEAVGPGGKTPLAYMLSVINDETAPVQRRDAMAIASAQYMHPRLSMVAMSNDKPRTVNNITVEFIAPQGYSVDGAGRIIEGEPLRLENETEH